MLLFTFRFKFWWFHRHDQNSFWFFLLFGSYTISICFVLFFHFPPFSRTQTYTTHGIFFLFIKVACFTILFLFTIYCSFWFSSHSFFSISWRRRKKSETIKSKRIDCPTTKNWNGKWHTNTQVWHNWRFNVLAKC